jgi:hypothetical protein
LKGKDSKRLHIEFDLDLAGVEWRAGHAAMIFLLTILMRMIGKGFLQVMGGFIHTVMRKAARINRRHRNVHRPYTYQYAHKQM